MKKGGAGSWWHVVNPTLPENLTNLQPKPEPEPEPEPVPKPKPKLKKSKKDIILDDPNISQDIKSIVRRIKPQAFNTIWGLITIQDVDKRPPYDILKEFLESDEFADEGDLPTDRYTKWFDGRHNVGGKSMKRRSMKRRSKKRKSIKRRSIKRRSKKKRSKNYMNNS